MQNPSIQQIGIFDAKTHLSQILTDVARGNQFAITRHGKIVAFLVPALNQPQANTSEVIKSMMALQQKVAKNRAKLTLQDIQKFKEKGRK